MGVPGAINDVQPFAELFQGATTVVYKAYQRSLDRFVLLKRVRPEYRFDEALAQRFEDEARLVARVQHPNVVALYAYGQDADGAYLVAEFVEGMDLRTLVERGRLPAELAVFVLEETAKGLRAAHERGVLHRDLKPSNILLAHDGAVKLTDFGLASLAADAPAADDGGEVRGTLAYLPPEQVLGQPPTKASDLFSLGATFFELLTGRRAFAGATAADLFDAVLNHDPMPVLEANPHVPPALVAVCGRLLARDPSARYPSCDALLDDLRAFRRATGLTTGAEALRAFVDDPDAYAPVLGRRRGAVGEEGDGLAVAPAAPASLAAPAPGAAEPSPAGAVPARVPPYRRAVLPVLVLLVVAGAGYAGVTLLDAGPSPAAPDTTASVAAAPPRLDTSAAPVAGADVPPPERLAAPEPAADVPPALAEALAETLAVPPSGPALEPAAPVAREAGPPAPGPPVPGALRVVVEPYAEVFVDGRAAGTTPLRLALAAGTHEVVLRHPEFPPHRASVEVAPGEEARLEVSLWPLVGRLSVEVTPWAFLYVDGVLRDTLPPQKRPLVLAPGAHTLSLRHPAYGRTDTTVTISAGASRTLRIDLTRR